MILVLVIAVVAAGLISTINFVASAPTHGYISIAFDDSTQTQYDYAYPLLHAMGINATFYVITSDINSSSYMNVTELQTLQNNGNEIGSHSNTHPDFISLSDSQIQQECEISKQTLQSWGLVVNNFAYPYGERNNHTDSIVAEYYRSARSAYVWPYIMQPPISQFVLPGFAGETGDPTALSQLESEVDQVYSTNGWSIIFFHNVMPDPSGNPYAISTQDFQSFLNYIVSKNVATVTVNQGLDLLSAPVTPPSVTISPTSVKMYLGQPQTFDSSVSGGRPPYAYYWYLNNTAVPSDNGISWTFKPTQAGFYNVYLNVTDYMNRTTQSNIVNDIQVYNEYPLAMSTNHGTVSPSSGGYDVGSTFSISATAPVVAAGERYFWLGWTGSGIGSYTGMNNPASITMNGAITETASWEHQYYLTVSSPHGTSGGAGWYDSGSSAFAAVTPLTVAGATGTQYVFTGWSGGASGSTSPSNAIVMDGPKTATANWKTQYYLTVSSPHGTSGGAGWYDSGSSAFAAVSPSTVAGASGTQFVFTGWGGNASGIASPSNAITMNGPKTATATWKTQYYLTMYSTLSSAYGSPSPSSGWFDSGSSITGSVVSPVSGDSGTQYVCSGWSGGGSVPTSGSESAMTFAITAPSNITWNWKTRYYLTVSSAYGSAGGAGWYDAGSSAYATVTPSTLAGANGAQDVFTSWGGDASGTTSPSNAIAMNAPKTATVNWSIHSAPTPTSSHTPTPSASPSPSPTPTLSPSISPTASPSSSPSQSTSASYSIGTYAVYGAVGALILVGAIVAVIVIRKRHKP